MMDEGAGLIRDLRQRLFEAGALGLAEAAEKCVVALGRGTHQPEMNAGPGLGQ